MLASFSEYGAPQKKQEVKMRPSTHKTPFLTWHKSHGAHMVNFAGWEMPLNYSPGIVEEHLATRKFGGLFDVAHMGRFILSGEGALSFLQHLLTNNAAALQPGEAQYTIIANDAGNAIDDAYLYRTAEREYLLVVNASNTEKDWGWFREHLNKFSKVVLEDKTSHIAMIGLQGPKSKITLQRILQETRSLLPDPGRNHLRPALIEGVQVSISRTGYTGEPLAFELFCPADKAGRVWEKIFHVGQNEGVVPVGLGARDTLRLEAGLPLFGHEFGLDPSGKEIPIFAVGAAKIAVSFSPVKGDYIGKEALWKQFQELKNREEGRMDLIPENPLLPRRVLPAILSSEGVPRPHFPVYVEGSAVGQVTSGTMVPYWQFQGKGIYANITGASGRKAIVLAYLDARFKDGQEIKVSTRQKFLTGRIVKQNLSAEAPPYVRPVHTQPDAPKRLKSSEPLEFSVTTLVKKAIQNTVWRQKQAINLIPSEQTPSPLVKLLSIADPCCRYAEHRYFKNLGEAEVYYYQGTSFIEEVEAGLQEEMSRYLGCSRVETRVISGQMANATVFSALMDYLNRFDRKSEPRRLKKVMNHHIGKGGHLSSQPMGALRDFLAVDPQTDRRSAVNFPVLDDNPYRIDLKRTEEYLWQHQPEMVILGKSMMIYREPLRELRGMVDGMKEKPLILYDTAHVLGLLGPYFQQPFLEGADIVTGSTHKTFFGTQRGIIASNYDENHEKVDLWEAIARRTFPGSVSNHHLGTLLGLLLATYEMNAYADAYQKQVIANAKAFAAALRTCGLQVEGDPSIGHTETHQVLLRVGYARGPEMARRLEKNNIIVNYQALPDDEAFSASSGLRLGVQEMTRFGMKEKDFQELAGYMDDSIMHDRAVKKEIIDFRSPFTQMRYCLPEEKALPAIQELLAAVLG
jgi:aminomethyltransferase